MSRRTVFGRPLSWKHYSSFSKFSITPPELEDEVARRNLKLHKIVGFDSVLPDFLHPYFPPSLLFAIATKEER
ncbi:MAG: hypothetical protein Q7S17_04195, partial [Xanthobacteraceae bacterium]|nr:hypothetical protein [Xanthobacteraceae bacterium]